MCDDSHPYLSGNFAPVQRSLPLTPCSWEGEIPADLAGGQYVRNGGNPLSNGDLQREAHWFDGDGMLSGVLFRRGGGNTGTTEVRPEFANQFLVTDVAAFARGSRFVRRPLLPSIAMLLNPCTTALAFVLTVLRTMLLVLLSRLPASPWPVRKISVANTAVLYHDGRALATCASGPPLRVALPSLDTIGWFNGRAAENEPERGGDTRAGFGGSGALSFMRSWTTAHPRVDHVTDELIAFHSVSVKPYVQYSVVPPAKSSAPARFNLAVPGVASPKMMHDFGVSHGHTIIMDLPLGLDPLNFARGAPVVSYDAAAKARFGVFPRHRPRDVHWFETNPCCIFHAANCWDDDAAADNKNPAGGSTTAVNLLACRLTSASLIFSLGNLPVPAAAPAPPEYAEEEQCRLYYYRFKKEPYTFTTPKIAQQWALSAIAFEFPTVSPLHQMADARYVYGCSTKWTPYSIALGKPAKIDVLAKIDTRALIARGMAHPPQAVKGCVDARTVPEILAAPIKINDDRDAIQLFDMPAGWFAQEPRFVPRAHHHHDGDEDDHDGDEDDGWLLTYVFDESQLDACGRCPDDDHGGAASELWIIDARSMRTVVARVRLPQRVPYGFHGAWFSERDIAAQRPFDRVREMPEAAAAASPGDADAGGAGVAPWMGLGRWLG
ncbi:carotenoid oxygenase [Lasiosphaeria miniovina]|uniref:Carotenoid oxygenase n=1 Tax=Lasiosphaeria miniovina TaxID=1954250 RepID=A0AA40AJ43_9PEZI|nr:carotenoid oxygenase [Lasiosphaeria miniovina]KAK0716813.1 carotenoid oxygenase [Lasiosphaeria miniovina]